MATDHNDALRNPHVDYESTDLSSKGILYFMLGLFIAGAFIEIVIWGMFHFLARSEALFPSGQVNPLASAQHRAMPETEPGSIMQNTPAVNLSVFPQPRLQTGDAMEMQQYLQAERKLLDPAQPFTDPSGAVHIPISLAMKLIAERGLPVRTSAPPRDFSTQAQAGNTTYLSGAGQPQSGQTAPADKGGKMEPPKQ
jgi:hypothetical protein